MTRYRWDKERREVVEVPEPRREGPRMLYIEGTFKLPDFDDPTQGEGGGNIDIYPDDFGLEY